MSEPLIVGIRHHSPACARLVKSLIESNIIIATCSPLSHDNSNNMVAVVYQTSQ